MTKNDEKKYTFELPLDPIYTLIYTCLNDLEGIRRGVEMQGAEDSSTFSERCYFVEIVNDLEEQLNKQGVDGKKIIEEVEQRVLKNHREIKWGDRYWNMLRNLTKELERYGINGKVIIQKARTRAIKELTKRRERIEHFSTIESFEEILIGHGIDAKKMLLEANRKAREKSDKWERKNYYDIELNCFDEELKKYGLDGKKIIERAYKKVDKIEEFQEEILVET